MSTGIQPFAEKKFIDIKGHRMAYIDEGEGAPIVFAHGNPTSSYVWRNIMPACKGLGRLVACDMIGMGDSSKLEDSAAYRYSYEEQRSFLFALWEELKIENDVVLVLHDWGSALGFDWASKHPARVQGIAYMEALVMPLEWSDFPPAGVDIFKAFKTPAGEQMVLEDNVFVEMLLPGNVLRTLSEEEMREYRRPYLNQGEDRRPVLSWPREIPVGGKPENVTRIMEEYGAWLAKSDVPKLYIHAEPGAIDAGKARRFSLTWPNQTEITVKGLHYVQEDSAKEIGEAVATFVRRLRM